MLLAGLRSKARRFHAVLLPFNKTQLIVLRLPAFVAAPLRFIPLENGPNPSTDGAASENKKDEGVKREKWRGKERVCE